MCATTEFLQEAAEQMAKAAEQGTTGKTVNKLELQEVDTTQRDHMPAAGVRGLRNTTSGDV